MAKADTAAMLDASVWVAVFEGEAVADALDATARRLDALLITCDADLAKEEGVRVLAQRKPRASQREGRKKA